MPELPEVEHVANALGSAIAGRIIANAELLRQKLAPDISPASFAKKLSGSSISSVRRRGKRILVDLDNGLTLIVHLRMSGRFMLLTQDDNDPRFTHAVFHFTDQSRLVFQDQRHFGLMKIARTEKLSEVRELSKLAPEPFSEDFTHDYFRSALRSSNRVLKELLLDQTKVCGVGNIYASEVLFLSAISPKRRGRNLSGPRTKLLYDNIRLVLAEAVELLSSIVPDRVVIGEGVYGNGADHGWRVYDREGEECPRCSSVIKRIRQGARSTYYCPKCQR
ncbi:MAG: bifunctional DNA-formamidopyrimidine glycosylase/DNA-(apurinic or apyrimidinic site) lyase [Pyrinomonadaceae bacterium]